MVYFISKATNTVILLPGAFKRNGIKIHEEIETDICTHPYTPNLQILDQLNNAQRHEWQNPRALIPSPGSGAEHGLLNVPLHAWLFKFNQN